MLTRKIDKIIIHCSDTKTSQSFDVTDIDLWHRKQGWDSIGYHYYIKLDGTLQIGRSLNKMGAHCIGQNANSIGICFEGGKNPDGSKWDEPTNAQLLTYDGLYGYLDLLIPNITVHAHNEFSDKSCPNFSISDIL